MQNLREALDQVFITHSPILDAVNETMRQQPVPLPDGAMAVPVPPRHPPASAAARGATPGTPAGAAYPGLGLAPPGLDGPSDGPAPRDEPADGAARFQRPRFTGRKQRSDRGDSVLNPYKGSLLERWNAGCRTAARLFRDLQQQGYAGSYASSRPMRAGLRPGPGASPLANAARGGPPTRGRTRVPPVDAPSATWLVLRRATKRTEAETQQLTQLHAQAVEVAEAIDLAQDFLQLVRQRQPEHFDAWLERASTSALEAVQRFASGLRDDYAAVSSGHDTALEHQPGRGASTA